MPGKLDGKRIAFLATDGLEQIELTQPWKAITDAGAQIEPEGQHEGQSA